MAEAGGGTLEEACIHRLPEAKRPATDKLVVPPWQGKDGPPAIDAHDLVRRFGAFVAVNHVSFRIEQGEIFGFLCARATATIQLFRASAADGSPQTPPFIKMTADMHHKEQSQ